LRRGFVITTARSDAAFGKAIEILPWHAVARGELELG